MNSTKEKESKSNNKKSSNKSQKYNSKKTKVNTTPLVEPKPTRSNSVKLNSAKTTKNALTPNNNNSNNNGKTKDPPSTTPTKSVHQATTPITDPPKFERSNSFSLTRSLSKLITSITGSKENISKVDDESSPYKFTRSRSMILLRRTNRRSAIEPQLEQLSEEAEKPPDQTDSKNRSPEVVPEVEFEFKKPAEPSTPVFDPQENFQKRRSTSFISSFRKTLAGSAEKKKTLNPKWSASLQSLQAIDNMVSYENMKFIDYDKFHNYEKNLERQLSVAHLETAAVDIPPTPTPTTPTLPVVVRRPKKSSPRSNIRFDRQESSQSAIFDSDFEHNLDKPKNLYRFSLDSRKLERLNEFSRGSMVFDLKLDALNLEDGSVGRRKRPVSFYAGSATTLRKSRSASDVVDAGAAIQPIMDETRTTGHQVSASSQKTFPNRSTSSSVVVSKSSISSSPTATLKKHRKLVRSPEVSVCDIPASVVATIAATVTDVMGGGFTTPPPSTTLQFFDNKPPTEPKRTLYNSFEEKHRKSDQTSNLSPILLDTTIRSGGGEGGGLSSIISPTLYTSTLPGLGNLGPLLLESPDDPPDFEYHTFSADSGNSQEGSGDIVSDPTRSCFSFKDTALLSMGSDLSTGPGNRNPSQEGDKFNRLQSFLFKTSSSDDGKTAPEKCPTSTTRAATSSTSTDKEPELDYYQYTLTSPNNPFLPEIIARAYRSESADSEAGTSVCGNGEIHDRGKLSPTQSLFAFSRSSSAEKSDSERDHSDVISGLGFEGGGGGGGEAQLYDRKSSSAFEPTSPGKHKRKLFSLNSPTREPKHHHPKEHPHHHQQHQQQHKDKISPQSSIGSSVIRSLNPFLSTTATTTSSGDKQEMAPSDLNAKREEFLRATMKICLVVSPPTSKLQLKSKSLTHLDGLDSMVACPHGSAVGQQQKSRVSEQLETALPQTPSKPAVAAAYSHPPTGAAAVAALHHHHAHQTPSSPSSQHHYPSSSAGTQAVYHHPSIASSTTSTTCNKMCCLGGGTTTISSSSALSPIATGVTGAIGINAPGSSIAISSISGGVLTNSSVVVTAQGAGATPVVATTATTVHKKKSSFMQRKKPLLTRSEIPSSEFFSVSFCMENGCQEEEFIPAIKGVTLSEALNSSLRRRNLSFSQIIITDNNLPSFLESGSPPYTSSFEENTDVENLVGRHLVITERDGKKTLQKAASFGSRTRPPRLLSSASTEETTESEQRSIPGKQLKQRWSGLFGIKNPHQSQLCELLNSYAKNGVPQKTASLSFDHPDFDAAQEYLDNMHSSWKDFVHCDNMSDVQIKIQTAIWELVTTEVYYIHALQTVTDLFLACLEAIQEDKLLTDVDQHKLFSNVRDICEANLKFWTLYLYPMVASSVASHAPLCIDYFRQGFVTFATIFAPYKKYCAEQSTCQFYCKELNRNNALFTAYLAWCESQKMCNRLRLADILVRPMQRLTKYNLLLTAIRRHVLDEDDADAIDEMIHSVENFVCSVNNHLTTRQENERLKGVMARIESYDVVDTNNEHLEKLIKQHSVMFDLCAPMKGCPAHQVRHLFMEGDHKYKDNLGKADVHCFLLTDILLVCKTIAKKGLGALKVIRQPYLTDRLVVQNNNNTLNCVYLNEFQVATSAFTLQCSEAKNWYESLKRAKHIYARLKQGSANNLDSFRYGGSGASGGTADSLGVKKSPINSSICSHVSSANNSHSGSVEWNDSRNISVEFEKTNSLSSDEGTNQGFVAKSKLLATSPHKQKIITSSNTLSVQPINHLGQSLPNLNLHHSQSNLYHTYSNNTLLVPGPTSSHSGNLLSPSHRGISYPPPSPTRATLRRGMAFSASIKNPPLVKSRNITSQNSINWHQIPATPTPTSPQSQSQSQINQTSSTSAIAAPPSTPLTDQTPLTPTSGSAAQLTNHTESDVSSLHISSTETDV